MGKRVRAKAQQAKNALDAPSEIVLSSRETTRRGGVWGGEFGGVGDILTFLVFI